MNGYMELRGVSAPYAVLGVRVALSAAEDGGLSSRDR
jgi:hypothetical protein